MPSAQKRTATVFDCPLPTLTEDTFRIVPLTKTTVCEPAETRTPARGVAPIGRPSRMTFDTGIELTFSVADPALTGGGLAAACVPDEPDDELALLLELREPLPSDAPAAAPEPVSVMLTSNDFSTSPSSNVKGSLNCS
jgi:hypothetical protein